MRIKINLDATAAQRLTEAASAERRPVAWQAEVLLRRALGLPPFAEDAAGTALEVASNARPD